MAGFYQYEQTIRDLDDQISYKQSEVYRLKATPQTTINSNTVITALEKDLVDLRNKRSYYTQFFSNLLMNNCTSCANGKCWKYY